MSTKLERWNITGVRIAPYRNCAVSVWGAGPVDVPAVLRKLDEVMAEISKEHEGIMLMVVVTPNGILPNAPQRKEIEAFLGRWLKHWRAVCYVAEGTDLWSMAARTVMTGLRLVQRRSYATNVFSEVQEGVRWAVEFLAKEPGRTPADTARGLETVIEELRRMA